MINKKIFYQKWNSYNSLFAIFIGHNDINEVRREYIEMDIRSIVNGIFNIVEDLYDAGARNILIFELLPVYRGPARNTAYKKLKKEDVLMFNNYIKINSKKFFNEHSNTNIIIYNTLKRGEYIIDHCHKFGFKDCTNAYKMVMSKNENRKNKNKNRKYKKKIKKNKTKSINDFFWNDSHLTEKGNKILTNDIDIILSTISKKKKKKKKKNKTKSINDFFWNDSHLTEKGNKILTNDIDIILSTISKKKNEIP